ncbi:MAG: DUF2948 family protein [Pseudomonadota bacterium]
MQDLKLIALDGEDLAMLAAQLQDAVVRVEDMAYFRAQRRFALIANRFDWMSALGGDTETQSTAGKRKFERRRCALRFERVSRVQMQAIDLNDKRRVLSMLTIGFSQAGNGTAEGTIEIVFSGGSALRLDVEYVEAELRDLGAAWSTASMPKHDTEPPDGEHE